MPTPTPPTTPHHVAGSISQLEIDVSAIEQNIAVVRSAIGSGSPDPALPGLCVVLKADAYGLGARRIAQRLEASGVDMLAVYTPQQATELIDAAISLPILILMPVREFDRQSSLYRSALRGRVHLAIHDIDSLRAVIEIVSRLGIVLPVHVEIDTGMSRGGIHPEKAGDILTLIAQHPRLRLAGLYTHFASADSNDTFTAQQAETFEAFLGEHAALISPDCLIHEANTFGVFRSRRFHRDMVRVGLAIYGYAREEFADPLHFECLDQADRLRPCLRWISRIVHLKDIDPMTPVGYGSTWKARKPTRLALVPIGYSDGYPMALSNRAEVAVLLDGGQRIFCPVVGRVSMDQITIDVTKVPEMVPEMASENCVRIGTPVELIGTNKDEPNYLPTLAKRAGTITQEFLCRLSPRLARSYVTTCKVTGVRAGSSAVPTSA